MHAPLSLTFSRIERSGALEARLRAIGKRLLRQSARITRCHLSLEGAPDGAMHAIKIHLCMPGAQIHAGSTFQGDDPAQLERALKAAYESARRQLLEVERHRFLGWMLKSS